MSHASKPLRTPLLPSRKRGRVNPWTLPGLPGESRQAESSCDCNQVVAHHLIKICMKAHASRETKKGRFDGCRGCGGDGRWSCQGHHHTDLQEGRARRVASAAGPGRLLGTVVRPL